MREAASLAKNLASKRSRSIKLRFSDAEYKDAIFRKPDGVTFAKWLRELALGQEIQRKRQTRSLPKADPELIREIARLGNNINQIARGINETKQAGETLNMAKILSILSSIDEQLAHVRINNTRATATETEENG